MAASFDKCYAEGGEITTETLSNGRYRRVCTLNGKKYYGKLQESKKGKKK